MILIFVYHWEIGTVHIDFPRALKEIFWELKTFDQDLKRSKKRLGVARNHTIKLPPFPLNEYRWRTIIFPLSYFIYIFSAKELFLSYN